MNTVNKILFWIITFGLGFVNPLFSVALVIFYYLPGIIQSACNSCDGTLETHEEVLSSTMTDYSNDILEEMK